MAGAAEHSEVRFAPSDGGNIAYRVVGSGPVDVVFSGGFGSHLDLMWADPFFHRFANRIARFARFIVFDKRGAGLSDPVDELPTCEDRARDWAAVMDHVDSERAFLVGHSESGANSIYFAATTPERVAGLVLARAR